MKTVCAGIFLLLCAPTLVRAADSPASVQEFGLYLIVFLNRIFIPFLFALALLFFIYFIVRYFIIDINNYDGKEKARQYALYSIAAFVLMVSLWGVVNLFVDGIGFNRTDPVCPDYVNGICQSFNRGTPNESERTTPTNSSSDTNTTPAANTGTDTTTTPAPVDETPLVAATRVVRNEINAAAMSQATKDTQLGILADPVVSDSVKVQTVAALYQQRFISYPTAQTYINTVNAVRAARGEAQIIVNLSNHSDPQNTEPR